MNARFDISINKKIFLTFIPALFIVVSVCFFSFSSMMRNYAIREISSTQVKLLNQISDKLNYLQENMVNISNTYLFDEDTRLFLSGKETDAFVQKTRYDAMVDTIRQTDNIFYNMDFYTTVLGFSNFQYVSNLSFNDYELDLQRIDAYRDLMGVNSSELHWMKTSMYNDRYLLSSVRYMYNSVTGEKNGIIIFDFDEFVLADLFDSSVNENEVFYIIGKESDILASSDKSAIGLNIASHSYHNEIDGYREGYFYDEATDSMVCFSKHSGLSWYVLSVTPYKDMAGQTQPILFGYLIFFAVSLLLVAMFLAILLSRTVIKPIHRLISDIEFRYNKEKKRQNKKMGDEILYLSSTYNSLIDRIDVLIKDIIDEQDQKRDLEIIALQSQINPHFLYNTLQSIRFLNRKGDRQKLEKTILSLVRLMSNLFKREEDKHTLGDELNWLKDYVFIQQVRYGSNFEVLYYFEDEDLNCLIDKLILQPIIENSIFHGLSSVESGGMITLSGKRINEQFKIVIKDNGIGEESKRSNNGRSTKKGIGLDNIRRRLNLLYQNKASLEICYPDDGGAVVSVEIPYITADFDSVDTVNF